MNVAKSRLPTTLAAEIEPIKVRQLGAGRFCRGKLNLIVGEPGVGTTNVAISVAASVSAGCGWPNSDQAGCKGGVLYISTESDPAATLRPRLEANGADLERVHLLHQVKDDYGSRLFSLETDFDALCVTLAAVPEPRLLILDRIDECLMGSHFESYGFAKIRWLLRRLEILAGKHDLAIVGVTKFAKANRGSLLSRVAGSSALVLTASAVFTVTEDKNDSTKRIFAQVRNNFSPAAAPISFRFKERNTADNVTAPCVAFVTKNHPRD